MDRPTTRWIALLAVLLPVLLAPRGFVLSLCMCGTGWGSSVCAAVGGGELAPLRCTCCADICAQECDTSEPMDHPALAQDTSCPHCRLATLESTPVDYFEAPPGAEPVAAFVVSALAEPSTAPSATPPALRTTGRAPPRPTPLVRVGLWPSVLPIRI
jgi:hypothetical protein